MTTLLQIRGGIHIIFFLFLDENICCGYSLEAPRRGASNEYPQHMFLLRNKNDISSFRIKKCLICCYVTMMIMLAAADNEDVKASDGLDTIICIDTSASMYRRPLKRAQELLLDFIDGRLSVNP